MAPGTEGGFTILQPDGKQMSVYEAAEEYKKRNLLSVEVTSAAVARSAISLCTDDFSTTTGASVPTDGGSDRVI